MKKRLFLGLILVMAVGASYAAPVDVHRAMRCGQKFVSNSLRQKSAELSLAYTNVTESGTDALYIFNFDQGYVVVAADDRAYPILGYCTNRTFDANNMPEGLRYYLGHYTRQIQSAIENESPLDLEIAEQWYLVDKEGVISRTRDEKSVGPLLTTTWGQEYPYNYYAPECDNFLNNYHCYAGCVACAMSQQMKYWNWPETGVGEHTYFAPTHGDSLSANFGETTYNWSIMPNQLGYDVDDAARAVALLMYHCGISVDMNYAANASGSFSELVSPAMIQYFRYGACTHIESRDSYTKKAWEDKLIASLDRGIPLYYAGNDDSGGHAFNCDGYDSRRFFHFNWGWSGADNDYFQIDALNPNYQFNVAQRAIFEMIPDFIYNTMVPAIESLTVDIADTHTKTAVVQWTVPSQSVTGAPLESIQQIVLKRNGEVIQSFNNPQPGTELSFEDQVDDYGAYEYSIAAFNNDISGEPFSQTVIIGPQCTWKLMCQTSNFQGWNSGKVQVVGDNGVVFKEVTMTNSTSTTVKFQMPEGAFSLNWVAPSKVVSSMTITLKNEAGQTAYSYSGSSSQLDGTIYTGANDCEGCQPPTNLAGEYLWTEEGFGTLLSWTYDTDPKSFKVYRSADGVDYELVATVDKDVRQYFDKTPAAAYFYKVTAFRTACESTPAFTADDTDYVYVTVTLVGENAASVRIAPNPANDYLSIHANDISEVQIFNLMGQTVYHYHGSTNDLKVGLSDLEAGLYLVKVLTIRGVASERIIISH